MHTHRFRVRLAAILCLGTAVAVPAAVRFVDAASAGPAAPYTNWGSAAQTIQEAVDVSEPGDLILVTNGTYNAGGRIGFDAEEGTSGVTNRVCVGKAVSVQSVNGPGMTAIEGAADPEYTFGESSVRGVCLTNGAVLSGFTIRQGYTTGEGGGVWCAGPDAVVSNCLIQGCAASGAGGGIRGGTIVNSLLMGNSAANGAGADGVVAVNCTIVNNEALGYGGGVGGGTFRHCIIYYNRAWVGDNYADGVFTRCFTTPLPDEQESSGSGNNSTNEPGLVGVNSPYLLPTSPCVDAGTNEDWMAAATDIDGEPRVNGLVDVGADELWADGLTGPLSVTVSATYTQVAPGFVVSFQGEVEGRAKGYHWIFGDGAVETNVFTASHAYGATGRYHCVLAASNIGTRAAATVTVQVVKGQYYVALSGSDANAGTNWITAKRRIQAAVDVSVPGSVIWVSNGLHNIGGRAGCPEGSVLTNRVAVHQPVTVRSVNGPATTFIVGRADPATTNGELSVRGAYLTNGAALVGFTITNGHTGPAEGLVAADGDGGGIWCESAAAVISNCVVTGCAAARSGGGVAGGRLVNTRVVGNRAGYSGGGGENIEAHNCAILGNRAESFGSGVSDGHFRNCIVYYNGTDPCENYSGGSFSNCCVTPVPEGESHANNFANEPRIVSQADPRLLVSSPCVNAGTNDEWMASATDMDGEPRLNGTVDAGADELWPAGLTGALSAAVSVLPTQAVPGSAVAFLAVVRGRAAGYTWSFGDGAMAEDGFSVGHAYAVTGLYRCVLSVSNATGGIAATVDVQVVDGNYYVRPDGNDAAEGKSWAAAKQHIQVAVDAAPEGATVWVTNGVYDTGGAVGPSAGAMLTNRVAIHKPLTVRSVNGPGVTVIVGHADPGLMYGDQAVRGVYLAGGAVLAGFTVTNGYTRAWDYLSEEDASGGGVWCASPEAVVSNCVITGNGAALHGGGVYGGRLVNCIVSHNDAESGGGCYAADADNGTIVGNRAAWGGGTAGGGAFHNCIVYYNDAAAEGNYSGGTFSNCFAAPLPEEAPGSESGSNSTNEPGIASLSAPWLVQSAACRDAGAFSGWMAEATDIDGEPRTNGAVDVGADEFWPGGLTGTLWVSASASYTQVAPGAVVRFLGDVRGRAAETAWNFGDGTVVTGLFSAAHAFGAAGQYACVWTASNETLRAAATVTVEVVDAHYYVALSGDDAHAGTSWPAAKRQIQAAVDIAIPGSVIWVSNGVYSMGGRLDYPAGTTLSNRLVVDRPVTVRSVNGPGSTAIAGGPDPLTVYGDAAVRCVYLADGAVLAGFTLSNGYTRAEYSEGDTGGGGLWCESGLAVVSNCIVTDCAAALNGGGAYGGSLYNCLVARNHAGFSGGGCHGSDAYNCTIVSNIAAVAGGGTLGGLFMNSIIYGNVSPNNENYAGGSFLYCDTAPLPDETTAAYFLENIGDDPLLADPGAGNYRLSSGSPCINGGLNMDWMAGATDLDGQPRITDGLADIGAYESGDTGVDFDGDGLPDEWEHRYSRGRTNMNPYADNDGDTQSNADEYTADTDPTNAASLFGPIVNAAGGGPFSLELPGSSTGRQYGVYGKTDLVPESDPWILSGPLMPGTGSNLVLNATNLGARAYYRAGVRRP